MPKERMIDAERLKADLRGLYELAGWGEREVHFSLADMDCNIDMEDSVEAEPVRHGEWMPDRTMNAFWVCSCCGFPSEAHGAFKIYKYCPNCGAKMDKRKQNEID